MNSYRRVEAEEPVEEVTFPTPTNGEQEMSIGANWYWTADNAKARTHIAIGLLHLRTVP